MPHPFQIQLSNLANRASAGFRNKNRVIGWETVDIRVLAKVIEVEPNYLQALLRGDCHRKTTEGIIERGRVVALVGVALRLGADEVERRIEKARALRELVKKGNLKS